MESLGRERLKEEYTLQIETKREEAPPVAEPLFCFLGSAFAFGGLFRGEFLLGLLQDSAVGLGG